MNDPRVRGKTFNSRWFGIISILIIGFIAGCGSGGGGGGGDSDNGSITASDYVVLAWNDLGMHCLNPTYDQLVILPPYNTLWAQVIKRGNPPQVVTDNLTVAYRIINNTSSADKRDYGQFWDNAAVLFGVTLDPDTGLNLSDPQINNTLSGTMQTAAGYFHADGIPITPVEDDLSYNPYQVAEITVKDASGTVLAQTRATVPVSDEINCGKCHGVNGTVANAFADILDAHDDAAGTQLTNQTPVLCANCHGSPALAMPPEGGAGSSGLYLSQAIHGSHAGRGAACYDCHPGDETQCSRSERHTAADGNCITCHGDMAAVSQQGTGERTPWVEEPKCSECHTGVSEVDTGDTLYRNAVGHGGVYCAGCHQSPHAMVPSEVAADNYQARQYQNASVSMGSCAACHGSSKGPEDDEDETLEEFLEEHGGANPEERSACSVCHTAIPATSGMAAWPHGFTWNAR